MKKFSHIFILLLVAVAFAQDYDTGFRRFDHDLLATDPVCIPENPTRVVSLEPTSQDINDATYRTGAYWVGWGFHVAHVVLDDLFTLVAGVDPADVSSNPFANDKR